MTFDRTTFASEPRAVVSILAVAFYLMLALVLPTNTTYYAKTSKYCCLSQEWQVKRLLSATRVYHHSLGHCHVLVWSDLRSIKNDAMVFELILNGAEVHIHVILSSTLLLQSPVIEFERGYILMQHSRHLSLAVCKSYLTLMH